MLRMDIDFSNSVRVLAVADQQTIVQFCQGSGEVDKILGFKDLANLGDSIVFIRYKNLSSVYDLKRRSKSVKLGGRSVLVETLADSPTLQEQCRNLCKSLASPKHSTPYLSRRLSTVSEKENIPQGFSKHPSSAPTGRFISADTGRFSNDDRSRGSLRSIPLARLSLQQTSASRSLSYKMTSDDSITTTIGELPSPLARSPTVFRESIRSNRLQTSRASIFSPPILRRLSTTSRRPQSVLLNRTRSLTRTIEPTAPHHTVEMACKTCVISEVVGIRKELEEAKVKYARSLEKVKDHLEMLEKKYNILCLPGQS